MIRVSVRVVLVLVALAIAVLFLLAPPRMEGYDSSRFVDTRYGTSKAGSMRILGMPTALKFDTKLQQYVYLPPGKLGNQVYFKVDPRTKKWKLGRVDSPRDATCETAYLLYSVGGVSRSGFETACRADPMHRDITGEPPPSPLDALYPRFPGLEPLYPRVPI